VMWSRRRLAPTDAKSYVETLGIAVRTSVPVVAYSRALAQAVASKCDGHDNRMKLVVTSLLLLLVLWLPWLPHFKGSSNMATTP
jgi:hypothetical protein